MHWTEVFVLPLSGKTEEVNKERKGKMKKEFKKVLTLILLLALCVGSVNAPRVQAEEPSGNVSEPQIISVYEEDVLVQQEDQEQKEEQEQQEEQEQKEGQEQQEEQEQKEGQEQQEEQ